MADSEPAQASRQLGPGTARVGVVCQHGKDLVDPTEDAIGDAIVVLGDVTPDLGQIFACEGTPSDLIHAQRL